MKIVDRYVLRGFLFALLSTIVFMIGLWIVIHWLSHLDDFDDARRTFESVGLGLATGLCRYYALHLPEMLVLIGPYVILIAAMFTIHHLNRGNELVPLFAAGISHARLVAPIFLASAGLTIGLVLMKEAAVPALAPQMATMNRWLRGKPADLVERIDLLRDGQDNHFSAESWDPEAKRLRAVWFYRSGSTKAHRFDWLQWVEDGRGGHFQTPPGQEIPGFDLAAASDLSPYDLDYEQRSASRLRYGDLAELHRRAPEKKLIAVLMHGHLTYPFTPFLLMLFGLPGVMKRRDGGAFRSIGLCVVLSLAFFTANQIMQRLGATSDFVSPALAAWLPVIGFGIAGLVVFESSR